MGGPRPADLSCPAGRGGLEHRLALAPRAAVLSTAAAGVPACLAVATRQRGYPQCGGLAIIQWPEWRHAHLAAQRLAQGYSHRADFRSAAIATRVASWVERMPRQLISCASGCAPGATAASR